MEVIVQAFHSFHQLLENYFDEIYIDKKNKNVFK